MLWALRPAIIRKDSEVLGTLKKCLVKSKIVCCALVSKLDKITYEKKKNDVLIDRLMGRSKLIIRHFGHHL